MGPSAEGFTHKIYKYVMIYTDPTPIKKNEEMFQNCCLSAKRTQAADVHVYNLNQ